MLNHPAESVFREHLEETASRATVLNRANKLIEIVIDELVTCGLDRAKIYKNEPIVIPGTYRERARHWDIAVFDDGDSLPVALLEVFPCSLTGSFGARNNIANRMDQIVALAGDTNFPFQSPAGQLIKPCLGVLFTQEKPAQTATPRSNPGVSANEEMLRFLQRILHTGALDAISYMTVHGTPKGDGDAEVTISEPDPQMRLRSFAQSVTNRVARVRQQRKMSSNLDAVAIGQSLTAREDLNDVVTGLTSTPQGQSAVELDALRRRLNTLETLRQIVLDSDSLEAKIQKAIDRQYWIFGGQYVGVLRRDLMPLGQHDIPLVCADRSVHIVELKRPGSPLVKPLHSGGRGTRLIPSTDVHDAVSQCVKYLEMLDEAGATLQTVHRNELGLDIDYRRAKATVLIGHPDHTRFPREQIDQTLRSYNSHLTRVQVSTYADLLDSAERALRFEEEGQPD